MSINAPMKPVGYTHKLQQGDWLITYEVVGWNERAQCNIWAEKKRTFSPRPSIAAAIKEKLLKEDDTVVVTAGVPVGVSGSTNILKVQTVGKISLGHLKL